ncbi:MAG: DNA translocase FtsK 4TM domain-containing protein [Bacteroidota bacterium]|jgi:S-DNA-T family DNA segregation ATPase FtsK/SpoIIIE
MAETTRKKNRNSQPEAPASSQGEDVSNESPYLKKQSNADKKAKGIAGMLADDRTARIAGLSLLLFTVVFVVSGVSYFFTWRSDNDLVTDLFSGWLAGDNKIAGNFLGKTGAILSHFTIAKGFGFATLLFSAVTFQWGMNLLFQKSLFRPRTTFFHLLPWVVSISFSLGCFFNEKYQFVGGTFGFQLAQISESWLGITGTYLMLVFMLGIAVIAYRKILLSLMPQRDRIEAKVVEQSTTITDEASKESSVQEPKDIVNPLVERFSQGEPVIMFDAAAKKSIFPPVRESDIKLEVSLPESSPDPIVTKGQVAFEIEKPAPSVSHETTVPSEFETEKLVAVQLPGEKQVDYDPKLDLSGYKHPPIDLLEVRGSDSITINNEELNTNKDRIIETLRNYGIEIDKIKATVGPTVTLYEIVPAPGVRISKIKNLEDDIALSLSALGIRIIAPIPGKGTIGIEVPNLKSEIVSMRSIMSSEKFQHTEFDLPVALGKTISNDIFIADLAKMPHLLMAGATGQGKSVGINAILVSLLYKKHPSQLKFVLVDPKKVELTLFNIIEKHFLAKLPDSGEPIITDTKKVIYTLNSLCIEMDNRYELLKDAQVRNLKEYNAKFISRRLNPNHGHRYLPYIVLVIDEFADLIMTAGKEVEMPIARLAQLARAIGIHLIIATQRPSVNIITGTIKANFPARIAFRVSAKIDSRTILDAGGAEQLIGRGDMLLSTGNDLVRIQCAFVDTPEVEKIAEFIGAQQSYPSAYELPEFTGEDAGEKKEEVDLGSIDQYFVEAARIIVQHQQGSTSLLQRRLKLGYNRAGRIVDQLEAAGIVGPNEGSKARQVMFQTEQALDDYLREKNFL